MFNQFFGQQQRSGGHQFHFQFNQGGHHQQHQQQRENLFENSDVIQLNLNEIFQFYRRREIWVLLFYKWSDEESKRLKDEYRALAEKMWGVLKVGAVDC